VLVFLGIPLAAGYVTRVLGERRRGQEWYEDTFLPTMTGTTISRHAEPSGMLHLDERVTK
jgi:ACR3 family arsenite efflux pump ArsB